MVLPPESLPPTSRHQQQSPRLLCVNNEYDGYSKYFGTLLAILGVVNGTLRLFGVTLILPYGDDSRGDRGGGGCIAELTP